jgi:hypothetical protein
MDTTIALQHRAAMVAPRRRFVFDAQGGARRRIWVRGEASLVEPQRFSPRWTRPCEKESGVFRAACLANHFASSVYFKLEPTKCFVSRTHQ